MEMTENMDSVDYGRFNGLIDRLVKYRHNNDISLTGRGYARHSCAIFVEENQSCLKPTIYRTEPPKLQLHKISQYAI